MENIPILLGGFRADSSLLLRLSFRRSIRRSEIRLKGVRRGGTGVSLTGAPAEGRIVSKAKWGPVQDTRKGETGQGCQGLSQAHR